MIVRELRRAGYSPDWRRVDTEAEYLKALESPADVVISDYSMPQFTGLRAVSILREREMEIPFVLVSGTVGEDVAVEAMRCGATDYLLKDRVARLGNAVARALEQRELRAQQRRALEALRESESKFRQLAENIYEVFWISNPSKTEVIYISPAYETVWGRTCESLYKSPLGWLEAVHPEDRPGVAEAAATKQIRGDYDEVYRIQRPDGSVRWIHDRAFPVRNGDGEVYRIVGTAEDITEHRQLEEQYRQSQKMEAIGLLSSGIAHDFNNILAIILMQTGLMKDEQDLRKLAEQTREIEKAAQRAAELTRQLLLFSRRQIAKPRDLDLNDAVRNLSKMLLRAIGEDIQLQLSYSSAPVMIHADPGMLDQILLNLSVNARDAMPDGGRLLIETTTMEFDELSAMQSPRARPGKFACLSVTDNGTGIAPEHLPRIFDPFFTTKDVGKGTGLGLATVFGIVQQHHGWLDVHSQIGLGTTFHIYLPLLETPKASSGFDTSFTALPGGQETILVVEDERQLRTLIQVTLSRLGYHVLEAATGVQALEVWRNHHKEIDLVLTDLVMPDGLSGKELAARLLQEQPSLKVIYTSGYSPDLVARNFELHEGENFLTKPFRAATLAETIRMRLDHP